MQGRVIYYSSDDATRSNPIGLGNMVLDVSRQSTTERRYINVDKDGYFIIPDTWTDYIINIPGYGSGFNIDNGPYAITVILPDPSLSSTNKNTGTGSAESDTEEKVRPVLRDTYFCGSNAEVYLLRDDWFEPLPLDVNTIQWQASHAHNPVYSFNNKQWDTLMTGNYLVQGGISMDLQQALYLYQLTHDGSGMPIPVDLQVQFILDFSDREKYTATYLLEDVYFTGSSHAVTPSGEPVSEVYEFIARQVKDNVLLQGEVNYQQHPS